MPTLPLHRPTFGSFHHPASRMAPPLAGVVAGTIAGFVAAAAIRRSGVLGPGAIELAPKDSVLEIDKGGVRVAVSRWEAGSRGGAGRPETEPGDAAFDAGDSAPLGATGIRPTFGVEQELDREIAETIPGGAPRQAGLPDGAREPALSATRA